MELSTWTGNAIAALTSAVLLLCMKRWWAGKRPPLPPGPKRLPIIGNLLDLPKGKEWIKYHEWCQEFNTDVLYLNAAGTSIVILDSQEAASELMDKRSLIYSGRVHQVMVHELMGHEFNFGFMPYGDAWLQRRRLCQQSLSPTASRDFRSHQESVVHDLLCRLLADPGPTDVLLHLRYMAGRLIMKITYGIDILEKNDPYIKAAEVGVRALAAAGTPGAFLVSIFPWLKYVPKWMPGAGFKRKAEEWRKHAEFMLNAPYQEAKRKIASGESGNSFVSKSLQNITPGNVVQEKAVMDTAGILYIGGSDTTVSAIASCVLGLLEHPEKLQKAQKQIDEVTGKGRLPNFSDYDSLPYITALTKESLRWRDVAPFGLPHMVEKDDEYKGYHIPANSMIISNCWAMLHDAKTYSNPFEFQPERFLTEDGQLDASVQDPATVAFGFGRRICPGRYMAMDSIWISLACMIAVFDIKKAIDDEGQEISLSHEYVSAIGIIPEPYKCSIKPRSTEAEELIRATSYMNE